LNLVFENENDDKQDNIRIIDDDEISEIEADEVNITKEVI
jgi:hypothetical protein